MTLYVLRNKSTGEYWRPATSYGPSWHKNLDQAKFYPKLGTARGKKTALSKFHAVEIVALSATVTGVIE